jgi:hypothetical protein
MSICFYTTLAETSKKTGICSICKKKMTKQKTFSQNIIEHDKTEKTSDILREARIKLKNKAATWKPVFIHEKCLKQSENNIRS